MHTLKSVGVLSVAKIFGLIYGCMGLIFVPLFLLAGVIGSIAGQRATAFSGAISIVLAVLMPVLYGVMGFIMGAIGALLYNVFANWVGGFELRIEDYPRLASSVQTGALSPNALG
jgi:hypothetical protein